MGRIWGFPGGSDSKESACHAGDPDLIPGLGRSPAEGNGYPHQYILPGEFHGQRSLVGYSPQSLGVKHNREMNICGAGVGEDLGLRLLCLPHNADIFCTMQ